MKHNPLFAVWLAEAIKVKSRYLRSLFNLYETAYEIFCADEDEICRIPDLPQRLRDSLCNKSLDAASRIMETCEQKAIRIIAFEDEDYPRFLRDIQTPPAILYCCGKQVDWNRRLCVGIVGTRNMSPYGLRTAYRTGYELAAAGAIVVSGMAAGVDGVSAAACIAGGGETVAVLGCGVDVVYPRHHANLMEEIKRQGILISEYPPGTTPQSYHFPTRNRIISGISQATLVVEASGKSGSLITAKEAILQGRDVYAVPSNVGSQGAAGTNGLLRDGAHLMLSTEDLVEPYLYAFESLRLDRLKAARDHSQADMAYLDRLGVIELTPAVTQKEPPTRPVASNGRKAEKLPPATDPASIKKESSPPPAELSPVQAAVLDIMPSDRPISLDGISAAGYPYGEILSALTMLELMGLVEKLPGGLYIKA